MAIDDLASVFPLPSPLALLALSLPGAITIFRRREMASALEARARFPQLMAGRDDKRIRFVVVHGLELLERPTTLPFADAEW